MECMAHSTVQVDIKAAFRCAALSRQQRTVRQTQPKEQKGFAETSVILWSSSRMKPRRLSLSVELLPTISETQEAGPVLSPQSADDYVNSIRELARPAWVFPPPVKQTQRPRLSSWSTKRGSLTMPSHAAARPYRPCTPVKLDDISLHLITWRDCRSPVQISGDPVDWLFAQTQTEDSSSRRKTSAGLSPL
ncbi:protein DEPP-like [Arapaima gigas]